MEKTREYQARKEFDDAIKPIFPINADKSKIFYDVMWKNEGKQSRAKLVKITKEYPEIAEALTSWGERWL